MNMCPTLTEKEVVDKLLIWIRSFSWNENDEQTDAIMEFTVAGITDCHLDEIVDVDAINDCVVKQVVSIKAEQFVDVHTIEGLTWEIVGITDALGRSAESIQVHAHLRLVEDGSVLSNDEAI